MIRYDILLNTDYTETHLYQCKHIDVNGRPVQGGSRISNNLFFIHPKTLMAFWCQATNYMQIYKPRLCEDKNILLFKILVVQWN